MADVGAGAPEEEEVEAEEAESLSSSWNAWSIIASMSMPAAAAAGSGSGSAGGPGGASQPGMELTSYGSGTHGYLPPECYDGDASRVDCKVDVFSAGVVHYVMLFYPHKPFFKQQTQQQIMAMKSHAVRQETEALEFPSKLSNEGQAFLRRALHPRRAERPDVPGLFADPYMLQQKGAKAS